MVPKVGYLLRRNRPDANERRQLRLPASRQRKDPTDSGLRRRLDHTFERRQDDVRLEAETNPSTSKEFSNVSTCTIANPSQRPERGRKPHVRDAWNSTRHILKGTIDHSLEYGKSDEIVHGYSDADWAGNVDDRRSTTGYIFRMNGGGVSWASKRQPTVALSTTEAEYMALAQATKEAVWLRGFLGEIGIDARHHFLREKIESGTLEICFCGTEDMTADVLTKGLCREKHRRFSEGMGIRNDGH